jgi:hypothetical protein
MISSTSSMAIATPHVSKQSISSRRMNDLLSNFKHSKQSMSSTKSINLNDTAATAVSSIFVSNKGPKRDILQEMLLKKFPKKVIQ